MGDELKNFYNGDVTCISNEFLNKYLADVNPVYLKIFIYLQWKKNSDISQIADDLNLTENDVEGAMKYWKKQMKKMGISYPIAIAEKSKSDEKEDSLSKPHQKALIKESTPRNTAKDESNKKEILFYAENVISETLNSSQLRTLNYIYDELGFDVKLIKYLIEYCADIGKTNYSYLKTVAEDWSKNDITTVSLAKKYVKEREEKSLIKQEKYKQKSTKKYVGINAPSQDGGDFDKIAMEKMRQKRKSKKVGR